MTIHDAHSVLETIASGEVQRTLSQAFPDGVSANDLLDFGACPEQVDTFLRVFTTDDHVRVPITDANLRAAHRAHLDIRWLMGQA